MTETLAAADLARYQDPLTIQRVLHRATTIAIVGLSANELRASHFVGYYLKRHGYRVIPVNPRETEILGETSYPSLRDVPGHVDIVNVFRAPGRPPRDRPRRRGDRRRHAVVPVRRDQRRGRPDRRGGRRHGGRWTAASRSSTRATSAGCTGSASTPSASPRSGPASSDRCADAHPDPVHHDRQPDREVGAVAHVVRVDRGSRRRCRPAGGSARRRRGRRRSAAGSARPSGPARSSRPPADERGDQVVVRRPGTEAERAHGRDQLGAVAVGQHRVAQLGHRSAVTRSGQSPSGTGRSPRARISSATAASSGLLVAEVVVERAGLDPELRAEAAHRQVGQPVGVEDGDRVLDHVVAAVAHVAPPRASR